MKKIMMGAVVLSLVFGLVSTVQANDWVKTFWEQQERQSGGSSD